jgi:PAS domain S-box-containing protein
MSETPSPGPWDRSLFDALGEGVVWHGPDGAIVDANEAAAPILGLTRDQLLGRSSLDPRWQSVHEDGRPWPGDEHPAMVALRTGQPQRGQIMGLLVPGHARRWIRIHATPLRDAASGSILGAVASFVELTEQIELRNTLITTTRELEDLYNNAPCGYHMLDAQGRYLRINDTEANWIGCSPAQLVGQRSPADFMTAEGQATFREHFPRLKAGESIEGIEIDLIGHDGQRRRLRINATPVLDEQGRFVASRSVLHDITELHLQRSALQSLSARQAAILDNDLIGIARLQGRTIVWANRALGRFVGYAIGELIGLDTAVLYPDAEAYRALGAAAYPVLERGGTYRAQMQLRRKDGDTVWVDCSGVLLDKESQEAIWFSLEITAQRRAEELRVRTAELEAENRQLRETSRLHGQFLSNMSHELRTPLNAVIGFSELLQAGTAPPGTDKHDHYLRQIAASGRHLLGMIDNLLEAASEASGRMEFHPESVDARTAVEEVVAMLEAKVRRYGVAVTVDVAPAVGWLFLDPLRFRQVLLNLIGNAIKFSPDGGDVQVRVRAGSAEYVEIEVEDHGIGIALADQRRLFVPFQQVSTGPSKTFDGTGIGLALVKRLVEAQGGSITVDSQVGRGSVFRVVLPKSYRPSADAG